MGDHIPWIPSASSGAQSVACPGWAALTYYYRKQLKPEDNTYSLPGTYAHLLIESKFRDVDKKELKTARKALKKTDRDENHFNAIRFAIKTIKKEIDKHDDGLFAAERPVTIFNDVLMFTSKKDLVGMHFKGTVDNTIVGSNTLTVIDYKHGAGVPVKAKDNQQGLAYLHGTLQDLKPEARRSIKTLRFMIVQPRCGQVDPVQVWEFKASKLAKKVKSLHAGVKNAAGALTTTMETGMRPDRKHLFRGDQCQFCPAKLQCPEWHEPIKKVVDKYKADKKLHKDSYPDISIGDIEQLLLDSIGINKYLDDGKDLVRSMIAKGKGAGVVKLAEGATREYPRSEAVDRIKAWYKAGKISKEDYRLLVHEVPAKVEVLRNHLGNKRSRQVLASRRNKPSIVKADSDKQTKLERAKQVWAE